MKAESARQFLPHTQISKNSHLQKMGGGGKLPWLFKLEPHQKSPPNQRNVNPSRQQPTAISVIHRTHHQTSRTCGIQTTTYCQDGCRSTEVSTPPLASTAIARPHPRPRFPRLPFSWRASQPNTYAFDFSESKSLT